MWHGFKIHIVIYLLLLPGFVNGQQVDGVIYDLNQNWVQYDIDVKSFLPAISQSAGSTISFLIEGEQYRGEKFYIKNTKHAYLFYKNTLLADLKPGKHLFDIDSLLMVTSVINPIFSLYGKDVKNNLTTLIVTSTFKDELVLTQAEYLKDKSYTSFYIIIMVLLLVALIIIKSNSTDLYSQYANVSRAFNFTTIDEIIYKGGFFINPNIQMISWMSFCAAFVLYFLLAQLNIHFLQISWLDHSSLMFHIIHLVVLTVGFLMLFVIRYVLIIVFAFVFDMSSIANIHFATHLRLTFYLLLLLQTFITLDYFSILPLSIFAILLVTFGLLFAIIILIGVRLSFIIRHPFVQIFLYLCGTEIFLFVFVYKLVVG